MLSHLDFDRQVTGNECSVLFTCEAEKVCSAWFFQTGRRFDLVAKSSGNSSWAVSPFVLVSAHGNVNPQSLLNSVSFKTAQWMRVATLVLHGEVSRHVGNGTMCPSVVGPSAVNEVTEQFFRDKFAPRSHKASGPAIKSGLEFVQQRFPGGIGPKGCNKFDVVHKAEITSAASASSCQPGKHWLS